MEDYRFAGYRIIQFPLQTRRALAEVSERLTPHTDEIVERWVSRQFSTWEPPGMGPAELKALFGGLLSGMLQCMVQGEPEQCIANMEEAGAQLARMDFPYEALIVSLHFLEESYMPFLLNPRSPNTQEWLIRMDEFLHVVLAALATSYFDFHRSALLAEAEVGRLVQEGLTPQLPKRIGDLEAGFIYRSATVGARLGGDFLDIFKLKDGGIAFVVGDLSGHGLDAIADSVMIRSLFRGFAGENPELTNVMGRLNRIMAAELGGDHFATALAGIYRASGELTLVNAGNPPVLMGQGEIKPVDLLGLPLAIMPDLPYSAMETRLEPGGLLVSYTDGLIEARSNGEMLGEARVQDLVASMQDAPPRAIAEHLLDRALHHARGNLQDDLTILVLKRICPRPSH